MTNESRGVIKDSVEGGKYLNVVRDEKFFTPPLDFFLPPPRKISWCISNYNEEMRELRIIRFFLKEVDQNFFFCEKSKHLL